MLKIPKVSEIIVVVALLVFYSFLLSQPINFSTADLGRHLKNGELFFQKFQIPNTNLYSYTYPDQPFINHHWGSGAIFYLVHLAFGFSGISILFIILSLVTFLIFFHVAKKEGGLWTATILAVIALPVIAYRAEIRPEIFSYLLASIFFWILWNYQQDKIPKKSLYFLPIITAVWVNLHIYFFLGGVLVLAFLLENAWRKLIYKDHKALSKIKSLAIILLTLAPAVLLNPSGLKGALYPLKIFEDYGYKLFENQSFFFIEKLFAYPPAFYFKILFIISLLTWLVVFSKAVKKKTQFNLGLFSLWFFFSFLGLTAVRNFTIFGYFAFAISSINLGELALIKIGSRYKRFLPIFLVIFVFAITMSANPAFWQSRQSFGLGLQKNVLDAAEFFKKNNLHGPVFNNYDVGGYLIYNLYPQEKVFVDNRPEAYPASFFQETYVPMQENKEKWLEVNKKYNFQTIFFWRNDLTPWGQKFLSQRINDPAWALVFADNYHLIFIKKSN
ncbi:MAG: hypothetical protein Q8R29_03360 [bacterium]|nr:hypothetical protein [bacterium]